MMSFVSQVSGQSRPCANIDWFEMSVCYEDSENDLNVISDDEDLETAKVYAE